MNLTRLGGATLLVGSVASICALVLGFGVGEDTGVVATSASLIQAVAGVVVLLGMPVLLTVRGKGNRGHALTLWGYVGIFAVTGFYSFFLHLVFVLVLPWVAAQGVATSGPPPAAVGTALFAAGVVQIICTGLLAAGVLRSRVYSRWVGGLLVLSTLLGLAFAALQSPIIRGAAAVTLMAALALVGVQLSAARPMPTPSKAVAASTQPAVP